MPETEDKEMSFIGHIGELRAHLVRSIIAIVIVAFVIGFNINWVMDAIVFGPTRPDFVTFRLVNALSQYFVGSDAVNMPKEFPIQVREMFGQFNMMMAVSIVGGIILAFPYIVWEIWKFISPALRENERKNSLFIINGTWVLFVLGALSGYYLVMPFVINFGYFFSISSVVRVDIDLVNYISLLLQVVVGMALIFLFPMVIYILTSLGLVTPKFLRKYRRHSVVLILVVAAAITPADIISMIAAALPLLLLYEVCIIMSSVVYKKMQKSLKVNTPDKNHQK
ncbi:twin-arginine translocase subunit TatC [Riemerella columbipharyngis]|uniref:Sec-independent protein translocase protein TatC n=1 Tax=Riemerella columbipharyngis TaxID=1071918 RepID=A0A1G6Y5R4_9FLAO|nr:twin-arginine translocase subunit TatC [Riemerella columbipharyngis]SDD85824.1 sec-independent protein translocase protein TatC [Riemerella columbipharyngis]